MSRVTVLTKRLCSGNSTYTYATYNIQHTHKVTGHVDGNVLPLLYIKYFFLPHAGRLPTFFSFASGAGRQIGVYSEPHHVPILPSPTWCTAIVLLNDQFKVLQIEGWSKSQIVGEHPSPILRKPGGSDLVGHLGKHNKSASSGFRHTGHVVCVCSALVFWYFEYSRLEILTLDCVTGKDVQGHR